MKVLVTGAGGFVGSHLVDSQLAQGNQVGALDLDLSRLDHLGRHPALERIPGDMTDVDLLAHAVRGADTVYHLASAHLDVSLSDDVYMRVNVDASLALVRMAHRAGVGRLVHCSTNGVVGATSREPVDESVACRPTNIYERSKWLGEQAVLGYHGETGFPVVVARPSWVYGPRCPRTARLLRAVRRRRFVLFGSGRTLRHPVYVNEAVQGLEQCAAAPGAPGQIYFLGGPEIVTIAQLVTIMAEVQGVRPWAPRLPLALGLAAGYVLQWGYATLGRQPPFSRRSLDFFVKDNAYNLDKARRELAFVPAIGVRQGLEMTVQQSTGALIA